MYSLSKNLTQSSKLAQ